MSVQSIGQFLRETGEQGVTGERFQNESSCTLRINVDGGVWLKPGAAIAYRGEFAFERLPTLGDTDLAIHCWRGQRW